MPPTLTIPSSFLCFIFAIVVSLMISACRVLVCLYKPGQEGSYVLLAVLSPHPKPISDSLQGHSKCYWMNRWRGWRTWCADGFGEDDIVSTLFVLSCDMHFLFCFKRMLWSKNVNLKIIKLNSPSRQLDCNVSTNYHNEDLAPPWYAMYSVVVVYIMNGMLMRSRAEDA